MASSVRRFVSMRPLGAIGESASWFGVAGVFGWTSGRVEFPVSQKPAKRTPRQLVHLRPGRPRTRPFLQS
ncbi:hypothetical protein SAMN05414139_02675 [Burkholderia sp. D7]|nr:hypothetical protein SAMN05414139_02675 [Burkholderia sp. D7]